MKQSPEQLVGKARELFDRQLTTLDPLTTMQIAGLLIKAMERLLSELRDDGR